MSKMVKIIEPEYDAFLALIIRLVDNGTVDDVFNDKILNTQMGAYEFNGDAISIEMLNGIKANPNHYRQFIGVKKQTA
jgi:antitoxin component HigA of HigAB toxin-antitoxin module